MADPYYTTGHWPQYVTLSASGGLLRAAYESHGAIVVETYPAVECFDPVVVRNGGEGLRSFVVANDVDTFVRLIMKISPAPGMLPLGFNPILTTPTKIPRPKWAPFRGLHMVLGNGWWSAVDDHAWAFAVGSVPDMPVHLAAVVPFMASERRGASSPGDPLLVSWTRIKGVFHSVVSDGAVTVASPPAGQMSEPPLAEMVASAQLDPEDGGVVYEVASNMYGSYPFMLSLTPGLVTLSRTEGVWTKTAVLARPCQGTASIMLDWSNDIGDAIANAGGQVAIRRGMFKPADGGRPYDMQYLFVGCDDTFVVFTESEVRARVPR